MPNAQLAGSWTPGREAAAYQSLGLRDIRRNTNFKIAFAAAHEVAPTSSAIAPSMPSSRRPCAVSEGIPARVAVGLIYVDNLEGFGYHMWHEVFVNHHW